MMIGQLGVGPSSATVCGGGWRRKRAALLVTAVVNNRHSEKKKKENHYAVLGVSPSASSADIKKAYRLLARQWHPDVSKDSRADEVFKNIHLAYQVLSDEATRVQYDRVLKSQEYATERFRRNIYYDYELEEVRLYKWSELRQKMRRDRYQKRYNDEGEDFSSYTESEKKSEADTSKEERGSFIEVLQSAFLSIFLMHTIGCQLSLMYSSLMAWFDGKLDTGYKLGYLIAWVMGGRGGVLLSMCLSFTSWAFGKNSSSMVTLAIVAMWVGANILSYAPLPRGAFLALLYMSVKLQSDLS